MTAAFVGLGANLGAPESQVRQALGALDAMPHTRVVKASSLYRSAPQGYAAQPDYVNAVAQLETGLPAGRLLDELQAIEARHGRRRSFANAPRTLDLDLLLFGNAVIAAEQLQVPHPRMHERAFVLAPLVEIAPLISIPGKGEAKKLLDQCRGQDVARIA